MWIMWIIGIIGVVLYLTGHSRNIDGSARQMFGNRLLAFYFLVICIMEYNTYYETVGKTYPWIGIFYGVMFISYAIGEYKSRIVFNQFCEIVFKNDEK